MKQLYVPPRWCGDGHPCKEKPSTVFKRTANMVKKSHPPVLNGHSGKKPSAVYREKRRMAGLWGKMGIVCLEEEIAVVNHIGLEIQLVHEPTGSLHGLLA